MTADKTQMAKANNFKRTLQDMLAKPPDGATFYRGIDLTEAQRARYVAGEVVTEPCFTSTTANPRHAFRGNTRFIVHGKHGKSLKPYSEYPDEDEVVFTADTRFRIEAVEVGRDGKLWIEVEEVE